MTTTRPVATNAPIGQVRIAGHNRVVVGMDEDPASVAALRFAATEAAYRGCDVLAVHVWQYPAMWGYPVLPDQTDLGKYLLDQLRATVQGVLDERRQAAEPPVKIAVEVLEGATAAALHDAAHDAQLLVLGARHHNWLVGSISRACSNHPPCPVVVVPTTSPAE